MNLTDNLSQGVLLAVSHGAEVNDNGETIHRGEVMPGRINDDGYRLHEVTVEGTHFYFYAHHLTAYQLFGNGVLFGDIYVYSDFGDIDGVRDNGPTSVYVYADLQPADGPWAHWIATGRTQRGGRPRCTGAILSQGLGVPTDFVGALTGRYGSWLGGGDGLGNRRHPARFLRE